jgi:hypothetical protein
VRARLTDTLGGQNELSAAVASGGGSDL